MSLDTTASHPGATPEPPPEETSSPKNERIFDPTDERLPGSATWIGGMASSIGNQIHILQTRREVRKTEKQISKTSKIAGDQKDAASKYEDDREKELARKLGLSSKLTSLNDGSSFLGRTSATSWINDIRRSRIERSIRRVDANMRELARSSDAARKAQSEAETRVTSLEGSRKTSAERLANFLEAKKKTVDDKLKNLETAAETLNASVEQWAGTTDRLQEAIDLHREELANTTDTAKREQLRKLGDRLKEQHLQAMTKLRSFTESLRRCEQNRDRCERAQTAAKGTLEYVRSDYGYILEAESDTTPEPSEGILERILRFLEGPETISGAEFVKCLNTALPKKSGGIPLTYESLSAYWPSDSELPADFKNASAEHTQDEWATFMTKLVTNPQFGALVRTNGLSAKSLLNQIKLLASSKSL